MSILLSAFLFFILSVLMSITNMSESLINPLTIGISAFSIFVRSI